MATIIAKEEIPTCRIVRAFVDKSDEWMNELQYAVRLGNEHKGKTRITFETTDGPRVVETTVWSVTENYMQIKGGLHIPLNSIIDIHF